MDQIAALRLAIDLLQVPSRVRVARTSPLPEGVPLLLRLASGDERAAVACAEPTGRSPEFLREAATFFIEQVLLAPDCDSYRVLGAAPDAPTADLRRNMALLLRWLHPDVAASAERSIFAGRITAAWEDLKTPERRAGYDEARGGRAGQQATRKPKLRRAAKRIRPVVIGARRSPSSPLKRMIWLLLGRQP
jgi:hypothetical protein